MGHYRSEMGLDREEVEAMRRKEDAFLREVERRAGATRSHILLHLDAARGKDDAGVTARWLRLILGGAE